MFSGHFFLTFGINRNLQGELMDQLHEIVMYYISFDLHSCKFWDGIDIRLLENISKKQEWTAINQITYACYNSIKLQLKSVEKKTNTDVLGEQGTWRKNAYIFFQLRALCQELIFVVIFILYFIIYFFILLLFIYLFFCFFAISNVYVFRELLRMPSQPWERWDVMQEWVLEFR